MQTLAEENENLDPRNHWNHLEAPIAMEGNSFPDQTLAQLSPSLPGSASSFQQNYFSILWQVIKHQPPEWSSHHTEALSEINGVSNSAFGLVTAGQILLRVSPELGTWKGFNNHQWALGKKNTACTSPRGLFFTHKTSCDRIFYVETGNHFYGEAEPCQSCCCGSLSPGGWDGAPWIPPGWNLCFLLLCTLGSPGSSSPTLAPAWAVCEPPGLQAGSVPLLKCHPDFSIF